jgi:hypothetical protein
MSTDQGSCSLGLSRKILSAWRDRVLPDSEAQRIAQHVAGCAVCQHRLNQFARIAAAVQRLPAPDLRAQTWRGFQAHLTRKRPMRIHRFAAFSRLGATALVAAIVVLFVVAFSHRPNSGGGPTGAPGASTATSVPDCPNFFAGYYTQIPDPHYTSTNVYADIPLPPDSRIVPNDASGGVRGYDVCSPGTVESITSFMTEQLTNLGWTSGGDGTWTKSGYRLTLRITSATDWSVSWRDPDLQA